MSNFRIRKVAEAVPCSSNLATPKEIVRPATCSIFAERRGDTGSGTGNRKKKFAPGVKPSEP
jgi:hypothetical protein